MRKLTLTLCAAALAAAVWAGIPSRIDPLGTLGGDTYFTITFVTGTPPTTLSLGVGAAYGGPATPSQALYDAGNGVWTAYTSNTITMAGSYIKFRGDWRNASGTYANMFYNSLTSPTYTCEFSGTLDYAATAANAYNSIFRGNTRVTAIRTAPFQRITGSPVSGMFLASFFGMANVTGSLPAGFMDTSALTGPPAANMLNATCRGLSGVNGPLPAGFMNTGSLTGPPAAGMFNSSCQDMSNVTGPLPAGFLGTSGLTGPPSGDMYNSSCYGMAKITSGDFQISTNVSLTDGNIVGPLTDAWRNMPLWGGQVFWGTNVIHTVLTPTNDINAFAGSTNVPGYATMNANWK
jgi:hypothetical protein